MEPSASCKRSRNDDDDDDDDDDVVEELSIKKIKLDLDVSTSEVIVRRSDNYIKENENDIRPRDYDKANESKTDSEVSENENDIKPKLEEESGQQRNDINDFNENENDITIRKQEEAHFLWLFTMILNVIKSLKFPDDEDLFKSIKKIKDLHKLKSFSDLDLRKWKHICGYLYRYGSHGAGFAHSRALRAIRECTELKEILVKKSELKIISLGSGPGNDTVGLCSALSELQNLKSLKLTLVDQFKEWLPCIDLAKIFLEEGNFGKVSEIFHRAKVELSFIQADLTKEESSDYFKTLAEADVIVMSKLITILDRADKDKDQRIIIKSLHDHMKKDAVILLIDSCFEELWTEFNHVYKYGNEYDDDYSSPYRYMSSALAEPRFGFDDAVSSKLPVNVLVKK